MKSTFTLILFGLLCHFSAISNPNFFSPSSLDFAQLRSNLYIVAPDGSTVLMDGTLTQYDSSYSNDMDGMDARKMSNFSENWGMIRGATTYVIERRHSIVNTDSIFFRMWNMRIITYQIEFITANLDKPERQAILEDNYLHTATPVDLNGTTHINFSVTGDSASKASNRFRVVFTNTTATGLLPLTFISTKAFQQNNSVSIDWKTAHEMNVQQYDVERSVDGVHFEKASDTKANNLSFNNYRWKDLNPATGNNYYRVRSIELDGKSQYSDVMKVYVSKGNVGINLYPNPATGSNLNLQLMNQRAGIYEVRLLNLLGQTFMSKFIHHNGGSSIENLKPGQNIPTGIYQLEIKTPTGEKKVISVVF